MIRTTTKAPRHATRRPRPVTPPTPPRHPTTLTENIEALTAAFKTFGDALDASVRKAATTHSPY
jgi:hypothetical protein